MDNRQYSAIDLAYVINSWDMSRKEEKDFLDFVWDQESAYLDPQYEGNRHKYVLDVSFWSHWLQDFYILDQEYPAIKNDFEALALKNCPLDLADEYRDLELFFKVLRLKLVYLSKQKYVRIKLRTLLKRYGYKRRTAQLVGFFEKCMHYYGIEVFLKGNERCRIADVKLDDMLIFRIE